MEETAPKDRPQIVLNQNEDRGLMVLNREGYVLSADPLAETLLATCLAPGLRLSSSSALAEEFRNNQSPLAKTLNQGTAGTGVLYGEDLPEKGIHYRSLPLFSGYDQVIGAVITVRETQRHPAPPLALMGTSLEKIIDSLNEGLFVINTRWQINYANSTVHAITGYRPEEIIGKRCWEIFHSNLCRKNCPLRMTLTTGEIYTDREVILTTKEGRKKHVLVNTNLLRGKNNVILGGIQTFRDLTSNVPDADVPFEHHRFEEIVGRSASMQQIFQMLPEIAESDSNVLIQGESGTGKDLIAKAIHSQSPRRNGPFVAVNCSALTETLLESELFGHERGSFTGAVTSKVGRFELARQGTLFLDEIAEIKPEIQVKLLRVLEERSFERVGGTQRIPMRARIIAATNRNLKEAIRGGDFREDFYYRISTVPIYVPPLRERSGDIPLIVRHLIAKFNKKFDKRVRGVDPKVLKWFCRYPWPGNVRELEHVLEYCFVFVKGPIITERHLPPHEAGHRYGEEIECNLTAPNPLQEGEKRVIMKALEMSGGKRNEAARLLKISRGSLWRKMKRYGIE